jgi:hypothetical protein
MTAGDPFGTAELRAKVLAAWAASPARFREDANAEDDLVRGGYRDRVVVELAQNAADAAVRAGVPGRLLLTLRDEVLLASNTGAPLDAAGVESLSSLRASSKRDDAGVGAVGRFGVGFAAVLAVSDAPEVASTTGAVRWQVAAAAAEVAAVPGLAAEVTRRGGHVPVLRLPYPSDAAPLDGCTTTVRLPLRDPAAVELVRRLLDEVDDALLLALPGLREVVVQVGGEHRVVADAGRWQVVRRDGAASADLLADRPVEERARPHWSVTWARPLSGQPVPPVLHAPTPTDEPLDLPALLVASFPLDPTRRHVAPGELTDALVVEAAAAYVELALGVDDITARLAMVPGPVAAGRLDGALRAAVVRALGDAPLLRSVSGEPLSPREAVAVVGLGLSAVRVLGDVVAGLVPDHPVLERLGGRRIALADVVDLLAGLDRPPSWWRGLYTTLAEGAVDTEALGALPVPLADGRVVRGARGALQPDDGIPPGAPALGLRVVHPDAAHALLLRLGAAPVTPRSVLERPEVRAAVADAWHHPDPAELADAVLGLVQAADLRPGDLPWLGALVLPDQDGEPARADELLLPGTALADFADTTELAAVHPELVERWGARTLAVAGVLADLTVVEVHDVLLDPAAVDEDSPLPGLADWVAWCLKRVAPTDQPPVAQTVSGVPELDVVDDDAWVAVLSHVARRPELRAAVVEPVVVDLGAGSRALVPSYAAWFVRAHGYLAGRPPTQWTVRGARGLAGLYDELVDELADLADVDPVLLAAIGVRTSLDALVAEPGGGDELLARLGDSGRRVLDDTARAAYRAVSRLDPDSVAPPASVRVRPDLVVDHDRVVVLDAPHHLQLDWDPPPLVVPLEWAGDLAEVLDLTPSSELVAGRVDDPAAGEARPVPDAVRGVLGRRCPATWCEHDALSVGDREVAWWLDHDGTVRAATLDGLARGLAWAAGRWDARLLVAAVLAEPERADELVAESALYEPRY